MALRDDLNLCAPRMRRYARALIGGHPAPNKTADDVAYEILQRASQDAAALAMDGPDLYLHLYAMVTEGNRQRLSSAGSDAKAHMGKENSYAGVPRAAEQLPFSPRPRDKFAAALLSLALEEREALLLVVLEGLSYAQTARILKISRTVLVARLARARAALGEIPAPGFVRHPSKPIPSYLRVVK